jgi:thymidine kinase
MEGLRKGKLVVISGPMFSGKTSRLIELLEREMIAGRKIELFKPEIDKRYSQAEVVTHKGAKLPAKVLPLSEEGVSKILEFGKAVDAVGIDEAQFWPLESKLPEILDQIAFSGKIVYVSVLNRDHAGLPFGIAMELMARADYVQSLNAVCARCGSDDAYFTQRVIAGKEVFGERVKVGGKELYEPRCRRCFVKP